MGGRHSVHVEVRGYELDVNGHVNHANYHRYGEHARTELLVATGCTVERLLEAGLGPVLLETHARFLRELRYGHALDVETTIAFGGGKTFTFTHVLRRTDGVVAAEITATVGIIDSATRRLVPDPQERLKAIATDPELFG